MFQFWLDTIALVLSVLYSCWIFRRSQVMTPEGEHILRLVRNEKMHQSKRAALYVNNVKTEVQKRVSKHSRQLYNQVIIYVLNKPKANSR